MYDHRRGRESALEGLLVLAFLLVIFVALATFAGLQFWPALHQMQDQIGGALR